MRNRRNRTARKRRRTPSTRISLLAAVCVVLLAQLAVEHGPTLAATVANAASAKPDPSTGADLNRFRPLPARRNAQPDAATRRELLDRYALRHAQRRATRETGQPIRRLLMPHAPDRPIESER
jgi:hypothetical protein